eukprot:scaffold51145_cov73-Phaeocystis_antarctica.AAC.2
MGPSALRHRSTTWRGGVSQRFGNTAAPALHCFHKLARPRVSLHLPGSVHPPDLGLPPLAGQEGGQGEARAIDYDVAAVAPAA